MNRIRTKSNFNPTPITFGTITFDNLAWDINALAGSVLANIVGRAAPDTAVTLSPNDGRFFVSPDGSKVIRGTSSWSAGSISVTPTETRINATNSPHVSAALTAVVAQVPLQDLYPASGYNGTDTSGFATGNPVTATSGPVLEPTPTTPRLLTDPCKPILTYHEDPREAMTGDYVLTFSSFCRGGVAKVRVICCGNFVDVTKITSRTRHDWDNYYNTGSDHVEFGYSVNLKHSLFPASGWVRIYAISYPNDPTFSPRIIGPFLVKRKTTAYYDKVYQVGGPTPDFPATAAGFTSCVIQAGTDVHTTHNGSWEHVMIQVRASLTWDIANMANLVPSVPADNFGWHNKGQCDIICDSGVNLLFNKALPGFQSLFFGLSIQGTRYGPGVQFDLHYINVIYGVYATTDGTHPENRRPVTFMGCELFDSGGRYNRVGTNGYDNEKTTRNDSPFCDSARYLGVNWHDNNTGPKSYQLIRNSKITSCTCDQLNPPNMVVSGLQYAMVYNTVLSDYQNTYWDTPIPCIRFLNSSGQTITVEPNNLTAGNIGSRQLVYKRNGVAIPQVTLTYTGNSVAWTIGETVNQNGAGNSGIVSAANSTVVTLTNVVSPAGFGLTVGTDLTFTGSTGNTVPFAVGETVNQSGTGAHGIVGAANSTVLTINTVVGTFVATSSVPTQLVGATSTATANVVAPAYPSWVKGLTSGAHANVTSVGYPVPWIRQGDDGFITGTKGAAGSSWTPNSPGSYLPSQYVSAFNTQAGLDSVGTGLNGITATLLDTIDDIPMGWIGDKFWSTPITLASSNTDIVSRYDVHGDMFQPQGSSPENLLFLNYTSDMKSGQGWFCDWTTARDVAFINTAVAYQGARQVGHNPIGGSVSHFLFWHNIIVDDDLFLPSFIPDAASSISNCILGQCGYATIPASDIIEMNGNVFIENTSIPGGAACLNNTLLARGTPGTGFTNSTDLFVDYVNADFRPTGAALAAKVEPKVPFDLKGNWRHATSTTPGCTVTGFGG